jgi:hypothetical protein
MFPKMAVDLLLSLDELNRLLLQDLVLFCHCTITTIEIKCERCLENRCAIFMHPDSSTATWREDLLLVAVGRLENRSTQFPR